MKTLERTDFLANVLITAVEGGIGYWAHTEKYHWKQDKEGNMIEASVRIRDSEEHTGRWYEVTLETIATGIARLKDKEKKIAFNPQLKEAMLLADNEDDASYIDAAIADCIVQAALFGDIVYG